MRLGEIITCQCIICGKEFSCLYTQRARLTCSAKCKRVRKNQLHRDFMHRHTDYNYPYHKKWRSKPENAAKRAAYQLNYYYKKKRLQEKNNTTH